jgi:hypothetical protein
VEGEADGGSARDDLDMTSAQDDLVARLLAENASLRAQLDGGSPVARTASSRAWGWTLLATVLVVIGSLLAPLGIVANWARHELTDTNAFVATFAPLSRDPAVQAFVAKEAVAAVEQHVDISQVTGDLFDGIGRLGLGPKAKNALEALKGPATQGVKSLIQTTVDRFVASDQFSNLWRSMLQSGHVQMIATMSNDRKAIVAIGAGGAIGIQLGPVVARVKTLLVQNGLTLANRIPAVNRTIVISTSANALTAQRWYAAVIAIGTWLPWLALAFLIAGVLVARRRSVALLAAALALGLAMLLTLFGIGIGRAVVVRNLSPDVMPADAATVVYRTLVAFIVSSSVAVTVLALSVAVVAWFGGPSTPARRLRDLAQSGAAALRSFADRHDVGTGGFGRGLYRQRVLVRVVIALGAAALIITVRPLSGALIVWSLIGAAVLIAALEILQRPTTPEPVLPGT